MIIYIYRGGLPDGALFAVQNFERRWGHLLLSESTEGIFFSFHQKNILTNHKMTRFGDNVYLITYHYIRFRANDINQDLQGKKILILSTK